MRSFPTVAAITIALLASACNREDSATANGAATAAAASGTLTQADAERIVGEAEAAWSSKQVDRVMANYADNVVLFDTTTLAPTTDRNIITRGNASFLTMQPADFRVDPRHVQLLDNDTIVASGVLSFTANVGAARPVLKTRYTQVYQRQPDNSFKVVHEHMSSPPPGTGAP